MLDKTASPQTDFTLDCNGRPTIWTDWRVDLLKRLWIEGLSCRRIADELRGGITRNAVIGKITRLKINDEYPRKSSPTVPRTRKPVSPEQIAAREARAALRAARQLEFRLANPKQRLAALAEIPVPIMDPCSLLELNRQRCHWPVGELGTPEFHFCGATSRPGKPYCGSHCSIAYIRPSAKREDSRSVPFIQHGWGGQ